MIGNDNNQRSQVRIPVDEEIFVRDTVSGLEMGTLANIHREGFMVISDGGLKEDEFYDVVLELGGGKADIHFTAECLWISETGTGDQVWAGFQITMASTDATGQIDDLLVHYTAA
jgi:hypothetical protein